MQRLNSYVSGQSISYCVVLIVLVASCKPQLATTFSFNNTSTNTGANKPNQTIVFRAVAPVDSSQVLNYDEKRLEEIAKNHNAEVKYLVDSIVLEKSSSFGGDYNTTHTDSIKADLEAFSFLNKEKVDKAKKASKPLTILGLAMMITGFGGIVAGGMIVVLGIAKAIVGAKADKFKIKSEPQVIDAEERKRKNRKSLRLLLILLLATAIILLTIVSLSFNCFSC